MYSGKIVCNLAKWLFGQSVCIRAKVVVFGPSGCILAKLVVFGQSGLFWQSGFIRVKWLYSGKVVVFVKKWFYSGKVFVFGKNWL